MTDCMFTDEVEFTSSAENFFLPPSLLRAAEASGLAKNFTASF